MHEAMYSGLDLNSGSSSPITALDHSKSLSPSASETPKSLGQRLDRVGRGEAGDEIDRIAGALGVAPHGVDQFDRPLADAGFHVA